MATPSETEAAAIITLKDWQYKLIMCRARLDKVLEYFHSI